MDCIEFSDNKDGSVKIERKIAGVVSDRINVVKGRSVMLNAPIKGWRMKALELLHEPSAEVVIEVPPIPLLEPAQAEQLEILEEELQDAHRELCELEDILPEYERMKEIIASHIAEKDKAEPMSMRDVICNCSSSKE